MREPLKPEEAAEIQLPLIDLTDGSATDLACRNVGFFAIAFETIDYTPGDIDELFDAAKAVTAVDRATRASLDVTDDRNHRGYEQAGDRIAFEIGREAPDDGRPLAGPNRWAPQFDHDHQTRKALERYAERCETICRRVASLLDGAAPLWPRADHLQDTALDNTVGHLRLWRYPPGATELPAHADHGFLTMVLADRPGLEIETPPGSGRFARPAADGTTRFIAVNVGRLLHHASQGRYRPTVHRVRDSSPTPRYSLAYFWAPNDALTIGPPRGDTTSPSTVGDYIDWGYRWQGEVNRGASVQAATGGEIDK